MAKKEIKELEKNYEYPLRWKEYFDSLENNSLLGLKCENCESVTCPPMATCQKCGSTNLGKIKLNGEGRLKTLTPIFTAPEGYEEPYVFCYVEIKEGPWVPGRLNLDPEEAVKRTEELIGKKVTLEKGLKLPGDKHSVGNRIAPLFKIID